MKTIKETLELALEALEEATIYTNSTSFSPSLTRECKAAATALREALAEQPAQQEPVAKYIGECSEGSLVQLYDDVKKGTNFYTSPQPAQRTWVNATTWRGLTEKEILECRSANHLYFYKAIEAKLKAKNFA